MKIVGKIIAVIYSVLFSAVILAFGVIFMGKDLTSKEFLTEIVKSADLNEITIEQINIPELSEKYGNSATVEEVLIEEMIKAGLTEEKARELLNDEKLREFIAEKAGDSLDNVINGTKVLKVTSSELKDVLSTLELSDSDYVDLADYINKLIDEINARSGN